MSAYRYCVYGVTLHSDIQLALPVEGFGELAQISLRTAPASFFFNAKRHMSCSENSNSEDSSSWYKFNRLADHSSYVCWEGVGEFLVSAGGHQIIARQFDDASPESFRVYLLGQALSFALVKCGLEPIHATSVVVNGEAVAFLGSSGMGKSTLAACFLEAGYGMLTDDLLILRPKSGAFIAYPGPSRIKLYPRLASRFLGTASNGVAMNSESEKLVLPLHEARTRTSPARLKALYTLAAPWQAAGKHPVRIQKLTARESFLELVRNTFNSRVVNPDRLERQFKQTAHVVSQMLVKKLSYPRVLAQLPAVRDAILQDLDITGRAACGD